MTTINTLTEAKNHFGINNINPVEINGFWWMYLEETPDEHEVISRYPTEERALNDTLGHRYFEVDHLLLEALIDFAAMEQGDVEERNFRNEIRHQEGYYDNDDEIRIY